MTDQFSLPQSIDHLMYLTAMNFKKTGNDLLLKIIVNAVYDVTAETAYDRYDYGDEVGHDITLIIPETLFTEIIIQKEHYEESIKALLNKFNNVEYEYIRQVAIDIKEHSGDWRQDHKDILLKKIKKSVHKTAIDRIWGNNDIRIFLSHKVEYKQQAEYLKDKLKKYSFSSFVAHTSIQPTQKWLDEIKNALLTMDVFVALLTDNFRDSEWTDQEVGFAISQHVPIIPVSIDGKDPHGFMGKYQKLSASFDNIDKMAMDIYSILSETPTLTERLKNSAIDSFTQSTSFDTSISFVKDRLPAFKSLTDSQMEKIKIAFQTNNQIYGCRAVNKYILNNLYNITGKHFEIQNRKLIEAGKG